MTKQKFKNFAWNIPQIVASLIQGKDAEKLYKAIQKDSQNFPDDSLGFLDYDSETQSIKGSNVPRAGQINRLVSESGIRVAVPTDNVYDIIFPLIEGKFYTDFNALDVRGEHPVRIENTGLWKKAIELAEDSEGSVKFPFRVQGFYVVPDKEAELGYSVVQAPNFKIIQDEKINSPTGTRFSSFDENGIIVPDKKGRFNYYSIKDGV